MRSHFDEQLAKLSRELTEMGALCEEVIALSAKALTDGDKALAARVAPLDAEIDQKERDIESLCLKLLLQQQPVARDLRQISAALKMITDMERIGDQAEDIVEIIPCMIAHPHEEYPKIREMAKETIAMWDSVRRGEERYIFPFQEGADVMFNSALIYELAVLKMYAEPLLFAIDKDCPEYLEAKRLLKFLDYFLPMPSDGISQNSIIREFIGGSCFNV